FRQRGRPCADVLRPVPRRLGNRRPRGDSQGAPPLLLLLIRSTVWALTSPSRGEVGPGITEVTAATSAQLAEAMGAEGDLVAARLSRGCRCFGAWAGDELLGYAWLSTGPEWIGEVDLEIKPGDREAYIWNCLTLPAHRRQGVFGNMVTSLAARAAAEGLSRLWIGSVAMPAEKVIPRAGFAPVLHFSSEVLSGIRWVKVRSEAGADPGLLAAGRDVLGGGGGAAAAVDLWGRRPLRRDTWLFRAQPRRH